jgi:hypothetical protein
VTPDELYPTPTRRRLAEAIADGQVRHYHWTEPWTCWLPTDRKVTAAVDEMVRYGIARLGVADLGAYSTVRLTPAGQQWLAKAGAR